MKYKGLFISQCDDKGVLREVDGIEKQCKGMYFQIYADQDYAYEIDNFTGAFGVDMKHSEESIKEFIKNEVDLNLEEYKNRQLYALIDREYNSFVYDVRQFYKDFDIIGDAEKIAKMKFIHDYLMQKKPLDSETVDYLLSIARPLETLCDYFQADKTSLYESINSSAKKLFDEQIEEYSDDEAYSYDAEDDEDLE